MPSKESRKDAIRKFKEARPAVGIYAVRCSVTGDAWVGTSRNLDATRNSTWFCLQNGVHQNKPLQQEWTVRGEAAFEYEILDRLEEDVHPLALHDLLKSKRADWVARLNAQPLL